MQVSILPNRARGSREQLAFDQLIRSSCSRTTYPVHNMKSASSPVFIRMNFITESTRAGGESQRYEPNCPIERDDGKDDDADEGAGNPEPEVEWRPPEVGRQQTAGINGWMEERCQ